MTICGPVGASLLAIALYQTMQMCGWNGTIASKTDRRPLAPTRTAALHEL
jgi:hypothetical protein